jgi:hypothetical protein
VAIFVVYFWDLCLLTAYLVVLCFLNLKGYVKNVTSKGCFILLSRKIDAKVLLSNLSDGFVDNPEKDFPLGKLLIGR